MNSATTKMNVSMAMVGQLARNHDLNALGRPLPLDNLGKADLAGLSLASAKDVVP
jgi:hypothetical protein